MAAAWLQTLLGMLILHPSCSLRILFTPLRCYETLTLAPVPDDIKKSHVFTQKRT